MSQLGVILQESLRTSENEPRTILGLLTEQTDGVDREPRRRRRFKERLGFIGIGCCGATWGFRQGNPTEEEGGSGQPQQQQQQLRETNPGQDPNDSGPVCVGPISAGSGMNLAAALAAERQLRGSQEPDAGGQGSDGDDVGGVGGRRGTAPGTPWRKSLMRLLEETEIGDAEALVVEGEAEKGGGGGMLGNDCVCCVCMGRKKGAAFIPCGHTFCRVCSRELSLNRGSCPLCNRSIQQILDIF